MGRGTTPWPRVGLLVAVMGLSACLAEAKSVEQICKDWNKDDPKDPDDLCGRGVKEIEADEGGGGSATPCNADDVAKAEEAGVGGMGGVIGRCYFANYSACQNEPECLTGCIESKGASGGCAGCVGSRDVRDCMMKSCNGFNQCLNLPVGGKTPSSPEKCAQCARINCMTPGVEACVPK